jgi:hypothetical protein
VFSVDPLQSYVTQLTKFNSVQLVSAVQLSTVERNELVGEPSVRGLLFNRCEPLLLDTGSCVMGIVWEPRVRGMSAIEAITR